MNRALAGSVVLFLATAAAALSARPPAQSSGRSQAPAPAFTPPRGLQSQPIPVPPDNPMTAGKIKLGEQLFFDRRLSRTKAMSCETCHLPEKGWTDGKALSPRFDGSINTRHTPTLYEAAYFPDLYWDGRAKGLEAQILAAWRGQMGADPDAIAKDIDAIPAYKAAFEKELGGAPTSQRIVQALATFTRTIHAGDTPWDRTPQDPASLPKSAIGRGFIVFSDVAHCTNCHLPPLFTDTLFHNLGIGVGKEKPDMGRGQFLIDAAGRANQPPPADAQKLRGAFKTPTVRGATLSAPYFHDGSAATIEEVVDLVLKGGVKNENLDEKLQVWQVTPAQRRDLLTFLRSLTPRSTAYKRPALP